MAAIVGFAPPLVENLLRSFEVGLLGMLAGMVVLLLWEAKDVTRHGWPRNDIFFNDFDICILYVCGFFQKKDVDYVMLSLLSFSFGTGENERNIQFHTRDDLVR